MRSWIVAIVNVVPPNAKLYAWYAANRRSGCPWYYPTLTLRFASHRPIKTLLTSCVKTHLIMLYTLLLPRLDCYFSRTQARRLAHRPQFASLAALSPLSAWEKAMVALVWLICAVVAKARKYSSLLGWLGFIIQPHLFEAFFWSRFVWSINAALLKGGSRWSARTACV